MINRISENVDWSPHPWWYEPAINMTVRLGACLVYVGNCVLVASLAIAVGLGAIAVAIWLAS